MFFNAFSTLAYGVFRYLLLHSGFAMRFVISSSEVRFLSDIHFRSVLCPPAQERNIYLALAQRLWVETFEQSESERAFVLRPAMLAKWLHLRRAVVPSGYGTPLVDEVHDLSASWVGLLHTYRARCVMMGDPHQRWNGRISEPGTALIKVIDGNPGALALRHAGDGSNRLFVVQ
jgi:hypothetical protein